MSVTVSVHSIDLFVYSTTENAEESSAEREASRVKFFDLILTMLNEMNFFNFSIFLSSSSVQRSRAQETAVNVDRPTCER